MVAIDIRQAQVEGHTDAMGTVRYNDALSKRRAVADAVPCPAPTPGSQDGQAFSYRNQRDWFRPSGKPSCRDPDHGTLIHARSPSLGEEGQGHGGFAMISAPRI